MIKIKFAKFILVFTLAMVSMSACYPSDFECMDNSEIVVKVKKDITSSHQESKSESSQSSSSDNETHYCLCSLTCHSMFINFSTLNPFTTFDLKFPKEFQYTAQSYPEISYSLEKPPTV